MTCRTLVEQRRGMLEEEKNMVNLEGKTENECLRILLKPDILRIRQERFFSVISANGLKILD